VEIVSSSSRQSKPPPDRNSIIVNGLSAILGNSGVPVLSPRSRTGFHTSHQRQVEYYSVVA